MRLLPTKSIRTHTLFPYSTLFRARACRRLFVDLVAEGLRVSHADEPAAVARDPGLGVTVLPAESFRTQFETFVEAPLRKGPFGLLRIDLRIVEDTEDRKSVV